MKVAVGVESMDRGNLHRGFFDGFYRLAVEGKIESAIPVVVPRYVIPDSYINIQAYALVHGWRPDAFVGMKMQNLSMGQFGLNDMTTAVFQIDDPYEVSNSITISKAYDLTYTTHAGSIGTYQRHGVVARSLSFGGSHIPEYDKCADGKYEHDLVFVGTRYPGRANTIVVFKDRNKDIKFEVYGCDRVAGWDHGRVSFADAYYLAQRSKINLCFVDQPDSRVDAMKNKIFDIMAAGGFLLCAYLNELETYFEIGPGGDMDCFKTMGDLEQKVRFYLKNDAVREQMRIKGMAKVREKHLWYHRALQIIEDIKNVKKG